MKLEGKHFIQKAFEPLILIPTAGSERSNHEHSLSMHRELQQRVSARARPDRLDRGQRGPLHRPLHRPLHHLRRLHQEEEEGRKEIVHHGNEILIEPQ